MKRKIIHIDADSFYASVEIRENPSLRNLPIAVGGQPDKRGVIATCSYEAREFGVRSAMPSSRAVKLCPELRILRPNFSLYKQVSGDLHNIFKRYTSVIQPLSLDEAYLDVTDCGLFKGSATLIAEAIRKEVRDTIGITVSAGVAPNKFLAKVASDWNKPDGIYTIAPHHVSEFVLTLPVNRINGVGKVTAEKLKNMGVETCGDLQGFSEAVLTERFGSYGPTLYQYARGIDDRPVQTSRLRKSLSVERTFLTDLSDADVIQQKAEDIFRELIQRFDGISDRYAVTKRYVKVKCHDFTQTTLEEGLGGADTRWQDLARFLQMVEAAIRRHNKPIRLLGLGVRVVPLGEKQHGSQLELFD